jgi:hypothetical protein
MKINLPAFQALSEYLKIFGSKYAILETCEMYNRHFADTITDKFYEWKVEPWKNRVNINSQVSNAREELEQILFIGNPSSHKYMIDAVKSKQEEINKKLAKPEILKVIEAYNKKPEPLYIREDDNEDNWIIGIRKYIINMKYFKLYYSDVVQGLLLSKYNDLCNDIVKTYEYGIRANNLFPEKIRAKKKAVDIDLESKIIDKTKWHDVLSDLSKKEILNFNETTQKYKWQGIGRDNIGSLATLATYLEKSRIVSSYDTMASTAEAYFKYFNPKRPSEKRFREYYGERLGTAFAKEFSFITKL